MTKDNHPDAEVVGQPDGRASRRTIVRGAAWSVPVIAAAVTVPTVAASPVFVCPTSELAAESASLTHPWRKVVDTGFTGPMLNFWLGSPPYTQYMVMSDGPVFGAPAQLVLEATLPVVAGHTYAFHNTITTGMAQYINTRQTIAMTIDGVEMWTGDTQGNMPHDDKPMAEGGVEYERSAVYTATSTGSIVIRYVFTVPARGISLFGQTTNDDIIIDLPTITCS